MMQSINHEYVLTVDEVKDALWRYLRDRDRQVPIEAKDLNFKWNGPGEAFVSFSETTHGDR